MCVPMVRQIYCKKTQFKCRLIVFFMKKSSPGHCGQGCPAVAVVSRLYFLSTCDYFSVMMLQIETRFQSGSLNMLPTP